MKTKKLYIPIVLFILIGGFVVWKFQAKKETAPQVNNPRINILEAMKDYVGDISTSTNNMMLYQSEKLGLSFKFPQGWRIGDNHIMYGTFQLFNYPDTGSGKGFSPDAKINKIEAVIGERKMFSDEPSSDYPEQSRKTENVYLAGQEVIKRDVTLTGGQQFHTYIIPVPNIDGDYLMHITMYGNPDNFYILDDLVKTIEWKK